MIEDTTSTEDIARRLRQGVTYMTDSELSRAADRLVALSRRVHALIAQLDEERDEAVRNGYRVREIIAARERSTDAEG